MRKKDFYKLIPERLEPVIPNEDYYSVLISKSDLIYVLRSLKFARSCCFFLGDVCVIDRLISYLNEFLNMKKL